jgi:23S rRNA (adenine2503-C2)-methyltransferase
MNVTTEDTLKDIKNFSTEELKAYFTEMGDKPFRAEQIQEWCFKHAIVDFDQITNIKKEVRQHLHQNFTVLALNEVSCKRSTDGAVKWLFKTKDNHYVETVLIPMEDRFSVCVSTQVGCAMGCKFCRTATMGFIRNLQVGEILEQCLHVKRFLRPGGHDLTNVIFMGMGEPLKNVDNVDAACRILHNQKFFNLGKRRITISTSGVVPAIYKLLERQTPCKLAISLNGTNDSNRSSIMPVNNTYNMQELLAAVDQYILETGEDITFEYVLIKDITCSPLAAKELIKIAGPRRCKVNAIVLNSNENDELQAPSAQEVEDFLQTVRKSQVQITIRQPRGRDILAACGQLAVNQQKVA